MHVTAIASSDTEVTVLLIYFTYTTQQILGAGILLQAVLKSMPSSTTASKVHLPTLQQTRNFIGLGGPISLAIIGQSATTLFLTMAASGCSTVQLAAHQVSRKLLYSRLLLYCILYVCANAGLFVAS
jgi:Na+-driven multidrug efflux pump